MDLTALIKWANEYEINKETIDPKYELRAKTYLEMIVNKGGKVFYNNDQTQKFMDNIQEYLEQLEKIGISPNEKKEISSTDTDNGANDSKESPLIP